MYNEVLEVIRALYKVSREVQEEKRYAKIRSLGKIYDPLSEITHDRIEDGSGKISFKISKDLIMNS